MKRYPFLCSLRLARHVHARRVKEAIEAIRKAA